MIWREDARRRAAARAAIEVGLIARAAARTDARGRRAQTQSTPARSGGGAAARRRWRLAGLAELPRPIVTTFNRQRRHARRRWAVVARGYARARLIKVKLTGELALDLARVDAIRDARPDVWLGVDGNCGQRADLDALAAGLLPHRRVIARAAARARRAEAELRRLSPAIAIVWRRELR